MGANSSASLPSCSHLNPTSINIQTLGSESTRLAGTSRKRLSTMEFETPHTPKRRKLSRGMSIPVRRTLNAKFSSGNSPAVTVYN